MFFGGYRQCANCLAGVLNLNMACTASQREHHFQPRVKVTTVLHFDTIDVDLTACDHKNSKNHWSVCSKRAPAGSISQKCYTVTKSMGPFWGLLCRKWARRLDESVILKKVSKPSRREAPKGPRYTFRRRAPYPPGDTVWTFFNHFENPIAKRY